MSKKPTVLMILDGYGLNEKAEGNAVALANTPVMDGLMASYPFVKGYASGLSVGLPDGQMGNSEVGHLNMGAGRIVYQELTRITKEMFSDRVYKNLKNGGVYSIEDIIIAGAKGLSCLHNIGRDELAEIKTKLIEMGFVKEIQSEQTEK